MVFQRSCWGRIKLSNSTVKNGIDVFPGQAGSMDDTVNFGMLHMDTF